MEYTSVVSSTMQGVGYDKETMTMEVAFVNGTVYQYFDVPEHVFQGLLGAASPGSFLNSSIRGVYRYVRL